MTFPTLSSFIKNTLTETIAGYILDARAGKTLDEKIALKAPKASPIFTGIANFKNTSNTALGVTIDGDENSINVNKIDTRIQSTPYSMIKNISTGSSILDNTTTVGNLSTNTKLIGATVLIENPTLIQNITESLTGTITSVGTNYVSGDGTNFLSFKAGDVFTQSGGPAITFTIASIIDDTTLIATSNVTSYSGMTGAIARNSAYVVDLVKINNTRGLEIVTEVFADNAEAAALADGTIYRTATGVLMIKY